jgi:hypothetical protein
MSRRERYIISQFEVTTCTVYKIWKPALMDYEHLSELFSISKFFNNISNISRYFLTIALFVFFKKIKIEQLNPKVK